MQIISDDAWNAHSHYFSKSRCNSYKFCPIQYKKSYVDKTYVSPPNFAMTLGSRFHEFAETFMAICNKYPVDTWSSFIHPDYTEQEQAMLTWFINKEIDRYNNIDPVYRQPMALEHKVLNHTYNIRGIVDRIDQLDADTIHIIEYKTGKSISKSSLQFEFGFYNLLLENHEDFNYDMKFTVINPRLQETATFNPSRPSTILNLLDKIHDDTTFKPRCSPKYRVNCPICTEEELLVYGIGTVCTE